MATHSLPLFHQEMEPASPLSFTGQLFSLALGITVPWEWHHAVPALTAFFLVLLEHSCHVAMPRQNCWMVRGHMEGWGHTCTWKRTETPTSGRHRQAPSCGQLHKWPPAEEEPPSWAQPIRILEKNYSFKPPEFLGGFYKTLDHWNRKLKNQVSPSILTVWFLDLSEVSATFDSWAHKNDQSFPLLMLHHLPEPFFHPTFSTCQIPQGESPPALDFAKVLMTQWHQTSLKSL